MCIYDFCYFLVFIFGIWGVKKGVFVYNYNIEIFFLFNIIFIFNFYFLKILLFLYDIYMLFEFIVFYYIYGGVYYFINF